MLKYSKQRESIKNFLVTRYDHPTAETVYLNIRREFPNISLGTVYRNLNRLRKSARSRSFPRESDRIVSTATLLHTIISSAAIAAV